MPKKRVCTDLRIASNFAVQDGAPLKSSIFKKEYVKEKKKKVFFLVGEQSVNHYRRLKKALPKFGYNVDKLVAHYRTQNIPIIAES